MRDYIKVGVGIIVTNPAQHVLLGKRSAQYLNGFWAIPAGHVERGETFVQAARRELLEEVGIGPKQLILIGINNYFDDPGNQQYVNFDFLVDAFDGKAQNLEPKNFVELRWFDMDHLPNPLAPPTAIALRSYLTKQLCVTEIEPFSVGKW